jgi:hypothetical protein
VIGVLQAANLWLGLYNDCYNWPWTYFFLVILMLIFAVHRLGRSLGFDAIIAARAPGRGSIARTVLAAELSAVGDCRERAPGEWRPGRIPSRRHRPEPPQTRQADARLGANTGKPRRELNRSYIGRLGFASRNEVLVSARRRRYGEGAQRAPYCWCQAWI